MDDAAIRILFEAVARGQTSIDQAVAQLRHLPFEDLSFAKVDHHRALRCGFPEVIYCEGKQTDQLLAIVERRLAGGGNLLATRATSEMADAVVQRFPQVRYNKLARTLTCRQLPARAAGRGFVAIVCAGTSDLPVAEAHRLADQLEKLLHVRIPGINRVLVHVSPEGEIEPQARASQAGTVDAEQTGPDPHDPDG